MWTCLRYHGSVCTCTRLNSESVSCEYKLGHHIGPPMLLEMCLMLCLSHFNQSVWYKNSKARICVLNLYGRVRFSVDGFWYELHFTIKGSLLGTSTARGPRDPREL